MTSSVVVDGLNVTRGGKRVLHDVSVTVPGGRITGLLGPSGCGKTTLMRAIVGVQIVESGTVTVLGEPAGAASLRTRVGYVTQAPAVYGDLTVRENLRYFARVIGAERNRIDHAIEVVGLKRRADAATRDLSGGERSRVSLATALLGDPEVLVLDEPTVGVDPVLRRELWRTLRELAADGAALLVSSHVMDEADRCDELILMRDGRVLTSGPPAELRERTGAENIEDAFLALVGRDQQAATA